MTELVVARARRHGGVAPGGDPRSTGGRSSASPRGTSVPAGAAVDDVGELAVLPGLVDTHVHVNEPGRTEWEGFETATRAAAAGGVTTLVDMPLNSIPPTTTREAFAREARGGARAVRRRRRLLGRRRAGQRAASSPGWSRDGVRGFKCFLVDSGVDEFGWVGEARAARRRCRSSRGLGVPLLVHAEVAGPIDAATAQLAGADPRALRDVPRVAPAGRGGAGDRAGHAACAARRGARAHIVHLSAASALPLLRDARAEGLPLTAETCPHYLHFAAEDDPRRRDAVQVRAADPRARRTASGSGRRSPTACSTSSCRDHSPCTPELKALEAGDFVAAWGGIAGLQLALPVVWTEARARGHSLVDVVRWMCAAPARLAGLAGRKGAIAAGARRRPRRVRRRRRRRHGRRRSASSTATRSRRTPARRCAASCTRRACAASVASPSAAARSRSRAREHLL